MKTFLKIQIKVNKKWYQGRAQRIDSFDGQLHFEIKTEPLGFWQQIYPNQIEDVDVKVTDEDIKGRPNE